MFHQNLFRFLGERLCLLVATSLFLSGCFPYSLRNTHPEPPPTLVSELAPQSESILVMTAWSEVEYHWNTGRKEIRVLASARLVSTSNADLGSAIPSLRDTGSASLVTESFGKHRDRALMHLFAFGASGHFLRADLEEDTWKLSESGVLNSEEQRSLLRQLTTCEVLLPEDPSCSFAGSIFESIVSVKRRVEVRLKDRDLRVLKSFFAQSLP